MSKLIPIFLAVLLLSFLGLSLFGIETAEATTIKSDGSIEPPEPLIQRNGDLYTLIGNLADSILIEKSNITIDGNGYTIQGPGFDAGISIDGYLSDAKNVTLRNLRITNFERGIHILESSHNTIYGNLINNTKLGIFVDTSSFNNISGNIITNPVSNPVPSTYGMQISGSSYNNTVSNNQITNNDYGIYLFFASLNTISRNNITNNNIYGIPLYSSFDNIIVENIIANNPTAGIYFQGSSHHITVLRNTITNNNRGIYMEAQSSNNTLSGNTIALNTQGVFFNNSTGNNLYENNFLYNSRQVSYQFPSFTNLFNSSYPVGGNFWSNYTGNDFYSGHFQNFAGGDALGDTAHTIDATNTDFYPLTGRFSSFQASQWYRVNTISNSTVQDFVYFTQNGTVRMHVSNSSVAQAFGFMRVTIPKLLIGPPYTVRVDGETPAVLNDTLFDDATARWIYFGYGHSTREITIQGLPDTTPPTVSVLSPQPRTYNTRDIPLIFTVDEPTSWLRYSLDGQNNITITGNTTILGLTDGPHALTVFANDRAANDIGGNTGSSPTISFSIDTTLPIVQITSPENKTYGPESIPLIFTVNEPVSKLLYSLDGQGNITITGDTTISGLSDGPHAVAVYANDTSGNVGKSAVHFSVDLTPPTIAILSPENRTYEARGLPLTFTLSESTSWIGYSLDNSVNLTISGNTTITNLSNGSHTVVICANDTLGNMGHSNKVHWTVQATSDDITPPIIQIISPENRTYITTGNTANVSLTFTVNEQVTWAAYSLDNAPNVTITGNGTLADLPLGSHRIVVYALDTAGNAGASGIVVFTVQQFSGEPFPPTWLIIAAAAIIIAAIAIVLFFIRRYKR